MKQSRVSIIIPAKNSATMLSACLQSIAGQSYEDIEIIIVDSNSADGTKALAKKYGAILMQYVPKVPKGTFDAPYKRNYGVAHAHGTYVYIVDADMELPKGLIAEAVKLCEKGADAVILPEDSFGIGPWARAKNLERQCYWGDDTIEAPRFFKKSVWHDFGGLDESLGGGGDDWDMYEKLKYEGYHVMRTKLKVAHNEGKLHLWALMRKRFMYGRDSVQYIRKRPIAGFVSYFPVRKAYIKNWRLFISRPKDSVYFIIMRSAEYLAGLSGIIFSYIIK